MSGGGVDEGVEKEWLLIRCKGDEASKELLGGLLRCLVLQADTAIAMGLALNGKLITNIIVMMIPHPNLLYIRLNI